MKAKRTEPGVNACSSQMARGGVCRASVNRSSHMAAERKTTFARAANFQVKRLGGDKIK